MTAGMPTVAEYVKRVRAATKPSTRSVYDHYWDRLCVGFTDDDGSVIAALGEWPLDAVKPMDLEAGREAAQRFALRRATSHDGQSAGEHYVAAARRLFAAAVREDLIPVSPAAKVKKPRRPQSPRHALRPEDIPVVFRAAASGGNDPFLDTLLVRFHLETGARRNGAVDLTWGGLDARNQLLRLKEKGGRVRWQPITLTLVEALTRHHMERCGSFDLNEPLFRYRNGTPLTRRRYNTLFDRIRGCVAQPLTAHVLRHTAITQVERVSSYAVAARFAGHVLDRPTDTYITVTDRDVAAAVVTLWGDSHPLVAESLLAAP